MERDLLGPSVRVCADCSAVFEAPLAKYCPPCRSVRFRSNASRAVGSRTVNNNGYVMVKTPDGRIVGEHRAVMEGLVGRPLFKGETVHHKNGDRADNRPENLELWANQPYGQRVEDLVEWAQTILGRYDTEEPQVCLLMP